MKIDKTNPTAGRMNMITINIPMSWLLNPI
jgi:hypothetical protein